MWPQYADQMIWIYSQCTCRNWLECFYFPHHYPIGWLLSAVLKKVNDNIVNVCAGEAPWLGSISADNKARLDRIVNGIAELCNNEMPEDRIPQLNRPATGSANCNCYYSWPPISGAPTSIRRIRKSKNTRETKNILMCVRLFANEF